MILLCDMLSLPGRAIGGLCFNLESRVKFQAAALISLRSHPHHEALLALG